MTKVYFTDVFTISGGRTVVEALSSWTDPIDYTNCNRNHDGTLIARSPASALIWVDYTVPGSNTTYSTNLVAFTSH
jgi:hypothetical protein